MGTVHQFCVARNQASEPAEVLAAALCRAIDATVGAASFAARGLRGTVAGAGRTAPASRAAPSDLSRSSSQPAIGRFVSPLISEATMIRTVLVACVVLSAVLSSATRAPADAFGVRTLVKIKVPSSSSSLVYCSRAAKRGPGSHRGREVRRRLADAGRAESPGVGGDRVEGHRLWG